jgi:plasmid segregation protein ParM
MNNNKTIIIGIDHGWSLIKTKSHVFVTGVKEIKSQPALFDETLEYEGRYYRIGGDRQEVKESKTEDDSFYLLTLAAIAKELKTRDNITEAEVLLAVGLPLTQFGKYRSSFIEYLAKNKDVEFNFEKVHYSIHIKHVALFPQCYAAAVEKLFPRESRFSIVNKALVVDIGSWTIDIMPVIDRTPNEAKCITIPRGLITCIRAINEQCVRQLGGEVDESEIQHVMRYGWSDLAEKYLAIIKTEIESFAEKLFNSIREYGYNLETTPVIFVGGGAVVMERFGKRFSRGKTTYITDICANAMGFERLAEMAVNGNQS